MLMNQGVGKVLPSSVPKGGALPARYRYALILALTRKERVVPQLNGNPLSLPMISVEIIECELVKQERSEVWLLFQYFSVN